MSLKDGLVKFRDFNQHKELEGTHALFGASKNSWRNYDTNDVDKLYSVYKSFYAPAVGTILHELASKYINIGFKLRKGDARILSKDIKTLILDKETSIPYEAFSVEKMFDNFSNFVNDAIGYRMKSEQVLVPIKGSLNFYGTADAISFNDDLLRIHDYKTGYIQAHIEQLDVYSAFFCLEYGIKPSDIRIEERIYQGGEILYSTPTADDINPIIDKIITLNKIIDNFKK